MVAALAAVSFVVVAAAQAHAATVEVSLGRLEFRAQPGEPNSVSVSADVEFRVEDRGAALTAGPGCRATADPHVVLCERLGARTAGFIQLGDRDDTLVIDASAADRLTSLLGESGNDTIRAAGGGRLLGGSGDDLLIGGRQGEELYGEGGPSPGPAGNDVLRGRGGNDTLHGGPRNDNLDGGRGDDLLAGDAATDLTPIERPDALDADVLRGGAGIDVATYGEGGQAGPLAPLRISFDRRRNDGRPHEHDNISRDVERAYSVRAMLVRRAPFGWAVARFRLPRNGGFLSPALRIYRLGRRGTKGAENGVFAGNRFTTREGRRRRNPTEIRLPKGDSGRCPSSARATSSGRPLSRRLIRRLRVRAEGRFRTRGRHSAATVRGTSFTVIERCDGTLTKVTRGTVVVRDFRRHKTVTVRAGSSYLARTLAP